MTASTAQYASVVNPVLTDLAAAWERYEDSCVLADSHLCGILAMTVDVNAQNLVLVLTGSAKPDVPGYIGAPPPEIVRLVDETVSAARDLDYAINDEGAVTDEVFSAGSQAVKFLDRWSPYT